MNSLAPGTGGSLRDRRPASRDAWAVLLGVAVLCPGCDRLAQLVPQKGQASPAPEARGAAPARGNSDVRSLIEQGRADEALAKLQSAPADADTLAWQGMAWAKKAETAPLPTPPPPDSPPARGAPPPVAPEFKPEELTAIDFFAKALEQRADHPRASLGLAMLLTPHAARHYELEAAKAKRAPVKRGARTAPLEIPPAVTEGPDASVDRVIRLFQSAVQGEPASAEPAEAYVRFCLRVGRLDEADAALRELVKRDKEKPEPFVRYGDFLAQDRKDPQLALEQYRQALIWNPDDPVVKSKIADIYINMGIESYSKLQYAAAEARFGDAAKYVTDPRSPQGLKIQDYTLKLGAIRKLPPH
ncbi:MAG TPA: hypothetical protein VN083_08440 [Vicinamibacteria bacterium]|jgi:tetratricopeptide (TPR) repeat protein|nr:hypothetical protein [Vicinamibacteria bacterium]